MKLHDAILTCCNTRLLIELLIETHVLELEVICPVCRGIMVLDFNTCKYHCSHPLRKQGRWIDAYEFPILKGTVFENIKIPINKLFLIIFYKLIIRPTNSFLTDQTDITNNTIIKIIDIIRRVLRLDHEDNYRTIGGNGLIVEIDETRIGPGEKSSKSHLGLWVLGGIERESKRVFLVPVKDRTTRTLLVEIKRFVKPNTIIYTDSWSAYNRLQQDVNYTHRNVNHRYNFVDPENGTHTQNVERLWGKLKDFLPKRGRRVRNIEYYLGEFYFNYGCKTDDLVHKFLEIVAKIERMEIYKY